MHTSVTVSPDPTMRRRRRRALLAVAVLATATAVVGNVAVRRSGADTAPPVGTPQTVSADALPTVQINGVVWSQITVGDTVYATGYFGRARPAGSAPGKNEVVRRSLLAYSISTGKLVTSFAHDLTGRGLVAARSPDGTRVYIGGDFTAVDGQPRGHIAAFDTRTGALVASFKPSLTNQVRAITATNTTVYVGGNFFKANNANRTRLAAFDAATGALTAWAPKADDDMVRAMVLSPDGSRVIVGGHFSTLNGVPAYGMGALSTTDGATLPWAASTTIKDAGPDAAITSLRTDGTQIYGGGYAVGQTNGGNFEGTFAANPSTGAIAWLNDCHGDTYDVLAIGAVLYHAGHSHDCSAIGSYPDRTPRVWRHLLAETTFPTGTNTGPDSYGWDYTGSPASSTLVWNTTLGIGSFTGQNQAAWSLTGNGRYLAVGGEFPTVNGVPQQGLVRFTIRSSAPNKSGPRSFTGLRPTVTSPAARTAKVTWQTTWDADNNALTYRVYRDGTGNPVYTTTVNSTFWIQPTVTFTDTGVPPGPHTYRLKVTDPLNNTITGQLSVPVTIG